MEKNELITQQPRFEVYVKKHWDEVKNIGIEQLRLVLSQNCQNLTQEEETRLQFWFNNQRTSHKRLLERQTKKEADQSTISHTKQTNQGFIQEQKNAQIYVDQAREIFTQLARIKPEERYDFCFSKFEANQLLFMKFMKECQRLPTPDFLNIVIQICENTQLQLFQTQLFIRVCALFKDGLLSVPAALVLDGVKYLAFETHDSEAAQGLLKLAYYNDVSFKTFPLDALLEFQRKYSLEFQCFYNHLGAEVDSQVIACLPPTCFLFTMPFYTALKQSGSDLHQMIDPDYLSFVIEILSYSFEDDQALFSEFLTLFKEVNGYTFGRGIDLKNLLIGINNEEIVRNPLFFGSLKKHIMLFKHLLEQLKEKRITTLNENIIIELLGVNEEQYLLKSQCPRIVTTSDEAENRLMAFWDHFYTYNKAEIPLNFQPRVPDCPLLKKVLSLFKINCLNSPQMIAFQLMKEEFQQKRLFQQFPTGIGKTTLSLIWIMYSLLHFNTRSITCYDSLELCEHDYEKLFKETSSLNPSITLISNEEHLLAFEKGDIIFVTTDNLVKLMEHPFIKQEFSTFQLVLDEFDCCLFDCDLLVETNTGKNCFQELINSIIQFNYLVAFTGSPLELIHKSTIENHLAGSTLVYPSFALFADSENVCHSISACSKRTEHTHAIINLCKNQALKTPVIVIIDDKGFTNIQKQLSIANLPWKNLSTANPSEIASFLCYVLTVPQNGNYAVVLMNAKQGRGLDIPTSVAIENEGGIYVLIGVLPKSSRELEQFKGRTRRMGNKGQYSVILWEDTSLTAEYFLKDHLNTASKLELQQLARQYASIKAPPLKGNINTQSELKLQQWNEIDGPKNGVATNEDMKDESKNSEESDDFEDEDDEDYVDKGKNKKDYEECKTCGEDHSKNAACKQFTKKRAQKSQVKLDQKEEKQQKHNNYCIDSLDCQIKENFGPNDAKIDVHETVFDPSNFLKNNTNQNSVGQSKSNEIFDFENDLIMNQETVVAHNEIAPKYQQAVQTRQRRQGENGHESEIQKGPKKEVDDLYFKNYSKSKSQQEMLDDKVRLKAYKEAIDKLCNGKVVLDLGCGTGILSLYALQAGAKMVYGIDNANIKNQLNKELEQFGNQFMLIKSTIEDVAKNDPLLIGEVDVIVSEWMGYFLLYENMIDSYNVCIQNFLKSDGVLIPSQARMYLCAASFGVGDGAVPINKNAEFKIVLNAECKSEQIISTHSMIKDLDFTKKDFENPLKDGFTSNFSLKVEQPGVFNALVGYFQVKLCEGNYLSTSPMKDLTHWKQSIFFVNNPIQVEVGDVIKGTIHTSTAENNHRNLVVKITYQVNQGHGSLQDEVFSFE